MRDFLNERTLIKAAGLSAVVTLLSLPRMVPAVGWSWLLMTALYLLGLFLAGAVIAWGKRGGLPGPFPAEGFRLPSLGIALLAGLLVGVLLVGVFDPMLQVRLTEAEAWDRLAMTYPDKVYDVVALLLWSISFELLFFQAAVVSTAVRVVPLRSVAATASVVLRLYVCHRQFAADGIDTGNLLLYLAPGITSLTAAGLYIRSGWPAAALFGLVVGARHFL